MAISKAWRLGGFIAALGASGALIASATGATGAYFTDSHSGTIKGSTGHLKLDITSGSTNLNFTDLVPTQYQQQKIGYKVDSSAGANEDIWLVFDPTSQGYIDFTGDDKQLNSGNGTGGLGRYGHFAVANNNVTKFTSYNLANLAPGASDATCPVDASTGDGGSNQQPTKATPRPPLCGVPAAIKLASNLSNGSTGEVEITFGVTGYWSAQYAPAVNVGYKIVATQAGVQPDATNPN